MAGEQRPRIAIINDDTVFLALMEELLEQVEGYSVSVCKESNKASRFVKDLQPDLVILDIRMGHEETGWTILNVLTLDPATRPIPVIVCSAAVDSLHAHADLLEKYDCEVLPKPFDLDTLLDKVRTALAKYGNRPRPDTDAE